MAIGAFESVHINNDVLQLAAPPTYNAPIKMFCAQFAGHPSLLHAASDQKLDGGKAWERSEWHVVARAAVGKLSVCVCVVSMTV